MQQLFIATFYTFAVLLASYWKCTIGIPFDNKTSIMASPLIQNNNSSALSLTDVKDPCSAFTTGNSKMEFSSPYYPQEYPNDLDCVKIIDAGPGNAVLVQFVDTFHIEIAEDGTCRYDYLEIRDGKFGYSPVKDKNACGTQPPTRVQSSGQYLWLRFHSDNSIAFKGFNAIVTFLEGAATKEPMGICYFDKDVSEGQGEINSDLEIHNETLLQAVHAQKHIDCTWVIEAEEGKRVFLQIDVYELENPNDCTYNKIEIYDSSTVLDGRSGKPKELCGSHAENVKSKDNVLAIRLQTLVSSKSLMDNKKKLSKFVANYTIYRELSTTPSTKTSDENKCIEDLEFDCQDNSCIALGLKCNFKINCQLRNDEEKCPDMKPEGLKADIFIIAFLGCILVIGMCGGMVLNIYRKLKQDKIELAELKEALRKSRESNLQSERHISLADQREPSQGSHTSKTSKETVIERTNPKPEKPKPNGDVGNLRTVNADVVPQPQAPPQSPQPPPPQYAPQTMAVATTTPPWYTKPPAIIKRRSSSSDIKPPVQQFQLMPMPSQQVALPPTEPPNCIEVRDCACQTRDSFLARLNLGRNKPYGWRAPAPLAIADDQSPVRRVSFPYFHYAASSASSETGRSLERLDEEFSE